MIAVLAAAAVVVACSDRMEAAAKPWPPVLASNVAVGPVLFTGLREYRSELPALRQGGWYYAKTPTALHWGASTTIAIAAADRAWAHLTYGPVTSASRLTLTPCDPATPRFSPGGGTVGVWTGFAGGFLVKHAGCVRFTVARGRKVWHARAAIGRRCP